MFIGNLGKDPEIRVVGSDNIKVAQFSIAVSESYTNKSGEKVENTEWINVVAWNKLADIIDRFLKKGDKVFVCGKMVTRSYDAQDGTKKYITEIKADELTMLSPKPQGEQQQRHYESPLTPPVNQQPKEIRSPDQTPDDLPF
jgi:single-strand DNA-binding protein